MRSPVHFHPDALSEFVAAAEYYGERSERVGRTFVDKVHDDIALICEFPRAAPAWPGRSNVRRRVLSAFPYAIIYTLAPSGIIIIAIEHTRRRPEYWKQRL